MIRISNSFYLFLRFVPLSKNFSIHFMIKCNVYVKFTSIWRKIVTLIASMYNEPVTKAPNCRKLTMLNPAEG